MRKRFPDYDKLKELYQLGVPVKAIATACGLSGGPAVSVIAAKLGLAARNPQGKRVARDARIVAEYEAGATSNELSEKYGFSPKYIAQIVRDYRGRIGAPHVTRKVQPRRKFVSFSVSPAAIDRYFASQGARP